MSVKHNNIVQLLNVYEDETSWWIVLEHCEQDLEKYLKSSNPSLDEKLNIMYECASGITYLHSLKVPIVHRDISLRNILLKSSNARHIVKICDFGLSRKVQSLHEVLSTDAGALAFRAPEFFSKIDGHLKYTASIDTFALGLVFKVLLDYGCEGQELCPTIGEKTNSTSYTFL